MGCWNATCNISNLPIFAGDKVVLIPLARSSNKIIFNTCYATDAFVPYALPLVGEYDDYGAIQNIQTLEENKKHLLSFEYFYETDVDGQEGFLQANKYDDFETFVKNIVCNHGIYYIERRSALHQNDMIELNCMMVHYDLYRLIVDEISNRTLYGSNKTMREHVRDNVLHYIDKTRKELVQYNQLKDILAKSQSFVDTKAIFDSITTPQYRDLEQNTFAIGTLNPLSTAWHKMVRKLLEEDADDLIDAAVEMQLFTRGLDCLRKGYLCDSGSGSQSSETRMHYLVAQFVIQHLADMAKKSEAEDEDPISPEGVAESFYY